MHRVRTIPTTVAPLQFMAHCDDCGIVSEPMDTAWQAKQAGANHVRLERLREADEYVGVQEIAQRFGVSKMTVYRLIEKRTLPHLKIGGLLRVPRAAVEEFIKANYTEGANDVDHD